MDEKITMRKVLLGLVKDMGSEVDALVPGRVTLNMWRRDKRDVTDVLGGAIVDIGSYAVAGDAICQAVANNYDVKSLAYAGTVTAIAAGLRIGCNYVYKIADRLENERPVFDEHGDYQPMD